MPNSDIDDLRNSSGGLDRQAVQTILPYGGDFLFVDEVTELTTERVEASFSIPATSPYLRAHFDGLPLMPGVLMGEGMAQAGTLMVRYNLPDHQEKDILAFQIEGARFSSPAQPGDRLDYRVRLVKLRSRVARLEGEALVGDREVCKAQIVLGIVSRLELRSELEALKTS